MNPFRTGKLVLFQVTYNRDWHFFEIIFFVILGIFGVRPFLIVSVITLFSPHHHIASDVTMQGLYGAFEVQMHKTDEGNSG